MPVDFGYFLKQTSFCNCIVFNLTKNMFEIVWFEPSLNMILQYAPCRHIINFKKVICCIFEDFYSLNYSKYVGISS